jgi:hypothetical protein
VIFHNFATVIDDQDNISGNAGTEKTEGQLPHTVVDTQPVVSDI